MEWFTTIAERYGFGAAIALLSLLGCGYACRELWKRTQELGQEMRADQKAASDARIALQSQHETELTQLREEYAAKLEQYAMRLDAIQQEKQTLLERWRDESKETVREVVTVASEMKTAALSSASALTFLQQTISSREKT